MPTVIDIRGLHKRYGATVAVDDISLQVEEGESFGILRPNGPPTGGRWPAPSGWTGR